MKMPKKASASSIRSRPVKRSVPGSDKTFLLRQSDLLPTARGGGALDGVEHLLVSDPVLETRRRRPPLGYRQQEVERGVREGVLVADDVSGRPPPLHVRVLRVRHLHGAEAALRPLLEVKLQLVHPLQVEGEAPPAPVDLEAVVVPPAQSEARGLDRADAAALELQ